MGEFTTEDGGLLRLGMPLELPPGLLQGALEKFAENCQDTRVEPPFVNRCTAFRVAERKIDVGLLRERPAREEFDAMPVVRENLGVLMASELAAALVGPHGVRLDELTGLRWLCFPRSDSPLWHDEMSAINRLRTASSSKPAAP